MGAAMPPPLLIAVGAASAYGAADFLGGLASRRSVLMTAAQ
jgi:hypothetical protein